MNEPAQLGLRQPQYRAVPSIQLAASIVLVLIKPQIMTRRCSYMTAIIFILVAGAVIAVIGTAAFVLIVIKIQTVDRSKRLMQELATSSMPRRAASLAPARTARAFAK